MDRKNKMIDNICHIISPLGQMALSRSEEELKIFHSANSACDMAKLKPSECFVVDVARKEKNI